MERVRDRGVVAQQQPVPTQSDDTKWLALTIRRGLLFIIKAIEERYPDAVKQERKAA